MESLEFRVRNMRKRDVPQVINIYKETGWHTGDHSIYTWLKVDPNSFKVAVTETDEVLGVCCAVRNHPNFYFIGYYIVKKNYRGLGIGQKIWNACMDHVASRNAGLNAVPDKIDLYRTKCGFSVVEDEWLIQENDTTKDLIHPENLSDVIPEDIRIVPFDESLLRFMFEYDFGISGYNRELALELNCKEKGSKTLVAFKSGICIGFGTIKRSVQEVPQIGPLYADDSNVAETLLKKLLMSYPIKKGLSMVTFAHNKAANELIKKVGCPPAHKLPRIYKTKPDFCNSVQRVFAHFDINCSPF